MPDQRFYLRFISLRDPFDLITRSHLVMGAPLAPNLPSLHKVPTAKEVIPMAYLIIMLLAFVFALGGFVVFLAMAVSIRRQDRHMSLSGTPRTPIDGATRRLVGVHVRR
ncbi:hypothetical protein GCM10009677_08710 [Sphaerisporangium rubeum]|uniref:Uncharacterized protein n=1 Tax=Sphaerisporangium rubeum TaxID=321317 RepID=A0A7X0IMU0_9ACTN|nr:hypothetical protein [Sphaerisporangium rubeum]MBB6476622.1 hypothetical protein [Sphaerisporangium rubeum]